MILTQKEQEIMSLLNKAGISLADLRDVDLLIMNEYNKSSVNKPILNQALSLYMGV